MIVDTSALVAITFAEPGHQNLIAKLTAQPTAGVGTPTLAETGLVLAARLGRDPRDLERSRLLDEFGIEQVPFGDHHWRESRPRLPAVREGTAQGPAELRRLPHLRGRPASE